MTYLRLWVVCISFLLLPCALMAQPLVLNDVPVMQLDQGQLTFLRDPSAQLTLKDVRNLHAEGQFKPLKGNLGAGYVPDAYWLHFSLNRVASQPAIWWLEVMPPYLDDIQLFNIDKTGHVDQRRGGDLLPQSAKEEAYRGSLFKLNLPEGPQDFYIRLKTTSTMVALVKLWQPQAFSAHLRNSYFAFGLYFSLILTVLIFNTVNWGISKHPIFIVYVIYLLLNTLQWFGISGFVSEFIFPAHPLLANLTLGMALSLASAMAFIFFSMLFELQQYHPRIYRINQFGALLGLITALVTPFGYYQKFAPWLLLTAIVSLVFSPLILKRLWKTQLIWNRLLVFAYAAFAVLVSLSSLGALAWLPFSERLIYAGMTSNIFHIMVLHFAIMLHYKRLEKEANVDYLTDVPNRRYFIAQATRELARANRYGSQLTMLMLDIDFFKRINDSYGHKVGDEFLKNLVKVSRSALREMDIIGRLGGEEFAVLLPETDKEKAMEVAERLRVAVAEAKVHLQGGLPISATISIGVASLNSKDENIDELLNKADKALYKAKETGRNKVCVAM